MKERVLDFWKTYLLSVSAQDMLLGEVSDHLYVGDVDFRSLAARGRKRPFLPMWISDFPTILAKWLMSWPRGEKR